MISRKCSASFLWLAVIAINSVRCPSAHAKASGTGDRRSRELTTMLPEMPLESDISAKPNISKTDPCYRFIVGDWKKHEFYSPGFEDKPFYANNSNCIRVLEAPKGHIIKLDFRDYFHIEASNECKNDYLEIRNGRHGFNDVFLRKFCGKEFPPMVESLDRYLWIQFQSDGTIEYKGFKAIYEFVPRPSGWNLPDTPMCRINKSGEEGNITKAEIPTDIVEFGEKYKVSTDCIWVITVKPTQRIQLQFMKFELDKPNECEKNFVQIFSNNTDITSEEKKFCGSMADMVLSKNNIMFVRFFAIYNSTHNTTFEANFTAYRDVDKPSADGKKETCNSDEFNCEDATCISMALKCNGRYNCRFRWDEDGCESAQTLSLNDDHIIVIMVIFSLILAGMCFTFIFNCIKKLIRDHQTIQEYIRQSREQQLNELDKQEPTDKKTGKICIQVAFQQLSLDELGPFRRSECCHNPLLRTRRRTAANSYTKRTQYESTERRRLPY